MSPDPSPLELPRSQSDWVTGRSFDIPMSMPSQTLPILSYAYVHWPEVFAWSLLGCRFHAGKILYPLH